MVQLSQQYMTTGKTIALTLWTFVGKVMPLLFNTLSALEPGSCSYATSRQLLLGRKAMTNLDSVLKSKDITFPTKVHIVKAMIFPVVMYGCESWTIKKAEH